MGWKSTQVQFIQPQWQQNQMMQYNLSCEVILNIKFNIYMYFTSNSIIIQYAHRNNDQAPSNLSCCSVSRALDEILFVAGFILCQKVLWLQVFCNWSQFWTKSQAFTHNDNIQWWVLWMKKCLVLIGWEENTNLVPKDVIHSKILGA